MTTAYTTKLANSTSGGRPCIVTLKHVREMIAGIDTASVKRGVFTVRRGFFYTRGSSAEKLVAQVLEAFPGAKIVDSGEVWKPFRGGASTAQQSHWWVKFTI